MKLSLTFKSFLTCLCICAANVLNLNSQVIINEYSAANLGDNPDNYGEYEDWVELYNMGSTAVDLTGYYFSDRLNNLTKWQFPQGSIPPNGRRIVFCSKKDEYIFGGGYHATFKLTQTKQEYIVLSDPTGTIIDSVQIIPTQAHMSRGRETDGAATWKIFAPSTFNASNNGGNKYDRFADAPTMSLAGGFYTGTQTVTISTTEPNSTIHYTTDGADPSPTSPAYTGPISVSNTTVVKAISVSNDPAVYQSFMEFNTYFINVSHTLPVVSVAGEEVDDLLNGGFGAPSDPEGSLEFFDENGVFIDKATGDFNKHGNDSWAYDQRGFDYITRDQMGYSSGIQHQIFPNKDRDEFQRLIIKAAANDNYPFEVGAHIRDAYVHALSQKGKLRLDERTYEPCIVYRNGDYWGVYELREKVDDPDFTDHYYNQDEFDIDFIKTWGGTWEEYGSRADWDDLHDFIVLNDMSIQANYDSARSLLNVGSLMDYMMINIHSVCKDWLNWNTAWWRGRNPNGDKKKWRYVLWDMDATFGHYINYTSVPNTTAQADPCDIELFTTDFEGHIELVTELMENPDFYAEYINRYADLNNTTFNCDTMLTFLDELLARITPEMPGQVAKWGGTMGGWSQAVQDMRTFIIDRCDAIDTGIVDCYNVTGPYPITVIVDPPGSGTIELNSLEITSFPWTGDYFGGIDIELEAFATGNDDFEYWELANNTALPNITNARIDVNLSAGDTIIAHFEAGLVIPSYNVTVLVEPPGAGDVQVNTNIPGSYPWTGAFLSGSTLNLTAIPNGANLFEFWEVKKQVVNPSAADESVFFSVAVEDTVIAHFVDPVGVPSIPNESYSIKVFPTITSGLLNAEIYLPQAGTVDLRLVDMSGKAKVLMVQNGLNQGFNSIQLDLTTWQLPSGTYLLEILSNVGQERIKVVYLD